MSEPMSRRVLGIDPGTTNCAVYDTQLGDTILRRLTRGKERETHYAFLKRVVGDLFWDDPVDAVVIENAFDRSAGRVLARFCNILQWEALQIVVGNDGNPGPVLLVNPVHLKQYVTGRGNPDKGQLYSTIEQHIASGRYPHGPDDTSEHVRDAYVLALMGQNWLAVADGRTRGLRGPIDVVRKVRRAWE